MSLSKQYSGFLARELGLQVNPHLLRHYAGMAWLDAMPGEYQGLAKLLGHASTRTTEAFYTGAEAKTAQTRWQHLLEGMIEEDKAAMTKTRRAA
ncbi:site-specific integrase [Rhodomicrobium vannielii]|uniref:site-specific integrase n=1 Tax=Rhodomicrobium vannielii TaxID=1069 RepID=UPI0001C2504A|nr:site-specific integrase [Rhodomicrobium vannielii]